MVVLYYRKHKSLGPSFQKVLTKTNLPLYKLFPTRVNYIKDMLENIQ